MVEINTFWSFLAVAGFAGWIAGTITFIFQAWDEDNKFYPGRAFTWGVLVVASFAVWVVGLYNA